MTAIRIILVEDDYLQSDLMIKSLPQAFVDAPVEVEVIKTELGFRERLEEIQRHPPDAFIIDVMLRWTSPSPELKMAPVEVIGRTPPGFRCQELLAASDATRQVPVLLYSAFHSSNWESKVRALPPGVVYLPKDDLTLLLDMVRKLTGRLKE